jgi:hypothetical protein
MFSRNRERTMAAIKPPLEKATHAFTVALGMLTAALFLLALVIGLRAVRA